MDPRPTCQFLHVRGSGHLLIEDSNDNEPEYSWYSSDSGYSRVDHHKGSAGILGSSFILAPGAFTETLDLATWAFGSKGLPQLQVLAYGDFTSDGYYDKYNKLFCRESNPVPDGLTFREMLEENRAKDFRLWDLVEKHMDAMSACYVDECPETS